MFTFSGSKQARLAFTMCPAVLKALSDETEAAGMHKYGMRQKTLPLPFNETERNGSFRSCLIIFRYPFWIRSRSVRIFRPFWIRFNLFPCCAICFSAWQFMILLKSAHACFLTGKMVFSDYTKKRILYYHAKGSHARSHHTHARSHRARTLNHIRTSLRILFAPVPSDSLVVLLYRSWLQHWIALNFSITHEQA